MTSRAATSTAQDVSPRRRSPSWSHPPTPRPTCAGRQPSWTTSAPVWPPWGSMPPASTPNRSGRRRAQTPGIAATPARAPHPPAGQPGNGPTIAFARSDLTIPWSSDYGTPARTRRGLRRTRPLVVPHRRLPDLRDDAHRRGRRLQPRPGRTSRRRKRVHLLLTAPRRHRARSVTVSDCRTAGDEGPQHVTSLSWVGRSGRRCW